MKSQPSLFNTGKRPVLLATDTRDGAYRSIGAGRSTAAEKAADPLGLNGRQRAVFDVVTNNPDGVSNSEIARALSLTINRITPRTLELRHMGLVRSGPRRGCRVVRGSFVQTWVVR